MHHIHANINNQIYKNETENESCASVTELGYSWTMLHFTHVSVACGVACVLEKKM